MAAERFIPVGLVSKVRSMRKTIQIWLAVMGIIAMPMLGHGSATLLLEEPFGTFGYLNPTGHAAIYLSNVCADMPSHLRRCHDGEQGVVISRYHRVGGYDWLAIPLVPYLYAVDTLQEIPTQASPAIEAALRDAYRRKHLETLVPDNADGSTPDGEWPQLIGALYDRKIFAYQFDTSEASDDALIKHMNERPNKSHFNLFFNNCADLSRTILNSYNPHSVHRNVTADLGLTTPKQLARSLRQYGERHERINLRMYVLPQVSGTIGRSKPVDGVIESFLKTKYVVPVAIFQPFVAVGLATDYLLRGRFNPGHDAIALETATGVNTLYSSNDAPPAPTAEAEASALTVSQSSLEAGAALRYTHDATDEGTGNMLPLPAVTGSE